MTSKTELCNLALLKLGKSRVQDIDTDSSQQATDLRLAYDFTLNQILNEAEWSFAVCRQSLNKVVDTPLYEERKEKKNKKTKKEEKKKKK